MALDERHRLHLARGGHVLENAPDQSEHVHHLIAAAVGGRRAVEDHVVGNHRRKRLTIAAPDRAQQIHVAIMRGQTP